MCGEGSCFVPKGIIQFNRALPRPFVVYHALTAGMSCLSRSLNLAVTNTPAAVGNYRQMSPNSVISLLSKIVSFHAARPLSWDLLLPLTYPLSGETKLGVLATLYRISLKLGRFAWFSLACFLHAFPWQRVLSYLVMNGNMVNNGNFAIENNVNCKYILTRNLISDKTDQSGIINL